jgi:hypothetical protein
MKKRLYSILLGLLVAVTGCDNDTDAGGTTARNLAGEWWVKVEIRDDGNWEDITAAWLGVDRILVSTYNTAANLPTEIFVDDHANFWDFKGKVKADAVNFTFGAPDIVTNLQYDDSEFIVNEGKVLKSVGFSKTGVATDSITFIVSFNDDDPEWLEYRFSGHRRTGFLEDEY